jgi:hypothetical protein
MIEKTQKYTFGAFGTSDIWWCLMKLTSMAYPMSLRQFRWTCYEIRICKVNVTETQYKSTFKFWIVATIKTCNKWFDIYIYKAKAVSLNHFEIWTSLLNIGW